MTEGHPDKVCDLVSDAVLDEVLKSDPNGRAACETFFTSGLVVVGGEISANTEINAEKTVRGFFRKLDIRESLKSKTLKSSAR